MSLLRGPIMLLCLNGGQLGRALILTNTKTCRFPVCVCTHATASRHPEHETCAHNDEAACGRLPRTTCLRANVLTHHKVSLRPDTTESKTLQVELQRTPQPAETCDTQTQQRPLLQHNQERTNRNTTDTTEGPETTTMTPRVHMTSNISDAARCIRAYRRSAKVFGLRQMQ